MVLQRYFRGDRCTFVRPMRVVRDDQDGLLLWLTAGSEFAALVDADGRTSHDLPLDELNEPRLTRQRWRDYDVLEWMPAGAAYSIWWMFADAFAGWYVNLESPYERHPEGVDSVDLVLDIRVEPGRAWNWKDEDEFAARTGRPGYFDAVEAEAIRAEGNRLAKLVEGGEFPFDGTHTDFRPDPGWGPLTLPTGWDREHRGQSAGPRRGE
ncbi:DUF402 domain-containing protein [Actinoplanes subtropicus]|uniref:DUF402 domain-containing protein n=1 Tax=Actinoplanes subtropicus TaxID=543632 RepID=UPI00068B4A2B|nr:DUF402 domain-containing protein [Actinoplanes subtropicus]